MQHRMRTTLCEIFTNNIVKLNIMNKKKTELIHINKAINFSKMTFKNSIRLHFDAITMYNNHSLPTAYFLSVISLEELGKIFILEDLIYHARYSNRNEKIELERIKFTYSHVKKQKIFLIDASYRMPIKFFDMIYNGGIEIMKQNSLYVGFPKNRKIDIKDKINNPLNISKSIVKKQITIMNNSILDLVEGVLEENYIVELGDDKRIFNKALVSKLNKSWSHRFKGKTLTFHEYLESQL